MEMPFEGSRPLHELRTLNNVPKHIQIWRRLFAVAANLDVSNSGGCIKIKTMGIKGEFIPIVHLHPATPELSVKRCRYVRYHILKRQTDSVEERAQVLPQ